MLKERERRNEDRNSTPERELLKRKGTPTLGGHITDWEILAKMEEPQSLREK